jgi:hypothetical protein
MSEADVGAAIKSETSGQRRECVLDAWKKRAPFCECPV